MATLDVYNVNREKISQVEVDDAVFAAEVKEHLFYDVIRMQLNRRRAGTHSTKTRAEVSGGGKKPWKQKGTGRARAGSSRSPIWRGGAIVFGPQPRSYEYRLPASTRRHALASALAQKARDGQLKVVDRIELAQPKTRDLAAMLTGLQVPDSTLVVIAVRDRNVELAGRNLPRVLVMPVEGINVYDILRHKNLLVSQDALAAIEARLG